MAHSKKCKYYPCDQCNKKFKYESTKLKHTQVAHNNETWIFCHFFNNNKKCPYADQCFYAHEEADICKFENKCERSNCMYKHPVTETADSDESCDDIIEEEDAGSDDSNSEASDKEDEKTKSELIKFTVYLPCKDTF